MTKIIIDIFMYFFEGLFFYYYANSLFSPQKKTSVRIGITFLCFAILGAVYQFNIMYLNAALIIILYVFMLIYLYDVKIKTALFHSSIFVIVMTIPEVFSMFVFTPVFRTIGAYEKNLNAYITLLLISKIIYFSIMLAILKIFAQKGNDVRDKYFWLLFLMPLSSVLILIALRYTAHYFDMPNHINILWSVSLVLLLLSNIIVFAIYEYSLKNMKELYSLREIQSREEKDEQYLEIIKHQNDEMHMMVHDVKNHFLTISNMKSTAEIDAYISEVMGNIKKYDIIQRTNNKMLDMLLSKYDVMCKNAEITLNIEAKTADLSYVNDADLSVLINNLMDNAFEAAKNSEERIIDFSLRRVNSFDILTVSNSCDSEPKHSGARLLTTKKSKDMHGLGTKIIKRYAAQNSAAFDWTYDQSSRKFSAVIMFNKQ